MATPAKLDLSMLVPFLRDAIIATAPKYGDPFAIRYQQYWFRMNCILV
jgi:hypothetical protein